MNVQNPKISVIIPWPRMKYRLILERENEQAIAKVGADNIPACEVVALEDLQ